MLQVGVFVAFFAVSAIYAAPSLIATVKGHRRWPLVVAINILLGWSIVGWLVALIMALGIVPRRPAWTKRARKPRLAMATVPQRASIAAADALDPPIVSEDVYATWLDQGAALPEDAPKPASS